MSVLQRNTEIIQVPVASSRKKAQRCGPALQSPYTRLWVGPGSYSFFFLFSFFYIVRLVYEEAKKEKRKKKRFRGRYFELLCEQR